MKLRTCQFVFVFSLFTAMTMSGQTNSTGTPPAQPPHTWPTIDHTISLPSFRFGTGETLPELKLHYLTLGTPHRNAAGHVDNAILLLHGTGGDAHSLLNPVFSDVLFVPGGILDINRSTSSSSPTTSATAKAPNLPTGCTPIFPPTTTTTWCAASG